MTVSRETLRARRALRRRVPGVRRSSSCRPSIQAAPTTVRDPREAADRHLADSLVALELAPVRAARRFADIGSGAGWPGLALAAALPDARVALVESAPALRLLNALLTRRARERRWFTRARRTGPTDSARCDLVPPARWRRSRCCASTRRRCCAGRRAGGVEGRATPRRKRGRRPRRPSSGWRLRGRAVRAVSGRATARLHVFAQVAPTPRRVPAARRHGGEAPARR